MRQAPRNFVAVCTLLAWVDVPSRAQFVSVLNDFVVSAQTGNSVYRPSVAAGPTGQFAVTWGDDRTTSDGRLGGVGSIYGSLYQSDGIAVDSNFRVDGLRWGFFNEFSLYHSSARFLPSGTLVVAYHLDARTTISSVKFDDIYYSGFSSAGAVLARDVQVNKVNNSGSGYGYEPFTSVHGSNFLVVYRYYVSDAYNIGISTVDGASGALLGNAFPIADNTTNNRVYPSVASNGTHVAVVWTDGRTDAQTGDIYVQRFVNGSVSGGNVRVNSDAAGGYNQFARVAMNAVGSFVVVWVDTRSHAGGDLYARVYNASGVAQGVEFKLTASNSVFQTYPPGLVMDASGDFVVTWADSVAGQRYTAKTRAFSSAGAALTPITEVTTSSATAPSVQPDVALGPGGILAYAWLDGRLDADNGRIYVKTATVVGVTHAGSDPRVTPSASCIEANYPNPFNGQTVIGYRVSGNGNWEVGNGNWGSETASKFPLPNPISHTLIRVSLRIYDLLGREVAQLVNGERPAGTHTALFDAAGLPSGVYVVRLEANGRIDQRKVTLLR